MKLRIKSRNANNVNIQNLPAVKEYRYCFKPRPGYKYIDCDFSQMELRILAQMSGDRAMIEIFESGIDMHTATAAKMFKLPVEECGKGTKWRHLGKTINFAIAYGKGPTTLAVDLGLFAEIKAEYYDRYQKRSIRRMPADEKIQKEAVKRAQESLDAYFAAFPDVYAWLQWASEQPSTTGYSLTLLGRKRYFFPVDREKLTKEEANKADSGMRNQGKNSPVQGGNADITKKALVRVANRILNEGFDACIVNVIHDELLVEVREDQAAMLAPIVSAEMIAAARELTPNVPIEADPIIADKWEKD